MPSVPNFLDPKSATNYGYDYNFFQKYTSSGALYAVDCNVLINMKSPTFTVSFQLESGGPVFYSFNGNTDHGDMNQGTSGYITSNNLLFQNRVISKIWFRGTGVIRVEAWANK